MSLFHQLEDKLKQAILKRQLETVDLLKLVKSDILLAAKTKGLDKPSDEICQSCLQKHIKNFQQAIDLYQDKNLPTVVAEKQKEMAILQTLLPKQLSDSQIDAIVEQVVLENDIKIIPANFKTLIDKVKQKTGASATSGQIAQVLKQRIKNHV